MVLWEVFGCSSRENIAGMTADWVRTWRGWEVVRNTVICYWQCCSYERDSAVGSRRVLEGFSLFLCSALHGGENSTC